MTKQIRIAIDGPASAGKSTIAKILAKELCYIYVDTGAMYRALTLATLQENIQPDNAEELLELLKKCNIQFKQQSDGQHVFLNGKDVSEAIRQPEVTNLVSEVSAHSKIREELVERQQLLAESGGVVMDGRDIGTVVLPEAELKIFLVASVEERAERRYKENLSKGIMTDFETLKQEIEERDFKDSTREVSPLVQAEDAIRVDTTGDTIEEVVEKIRKVLNNKLLFTAKIQVSKKNNKHFFYFF